MGDVGLDAQCLAFLNGTKTSEALSDELAEALYVRRPISDGRFLEDVLADQLASGRTVVVAGSAGGGKTMLIGRVAALLAARGVETITWAFAEDAAGDRPPNVPIVVPDLTAIVGDRREFLRAALDGGPLLLAANEGVLKPENLPEPLEPTLQQLREMQLGKASKWNGGPVVVDMAGLDALSTLEELLKHPLLHAAAELAESECAEHDLCPRLQALALLQSEEFVREFAALVRAAIGIGEIRFRDLWNFLSDVFLGGSCATPAPSSAWFWRVFYGDSSMADRLRRVLGPEYVALPGLVPALYRGDWQAVADVLDSELPFVDPGRAPFDLDSDQATELTRWLRLQAALILRSQGEGYPRFVGELLSDLESQVRSSGDARPLIRALNAYFMRQRPTPGDSAQLELWIEMSVERATERPSTLVSLGSVSNTRLALVKSLAIGNCEHAEESGTRVYLAAPEVCALALDVSLFRSLGRGRPVATSDRANDDTDFAVRRFYISLAKADLLEESGRLGLSTIDEVKGVVRSSWDTADSTGLRRVG